MGRQPAAESKLKGSDVRARVTDWIRRLEGLYDQLDEWVRGLPDTTVERGELTQLIEHLMEEFNVRPRKVPTYTIFRSKRRRVSFVPSVIWIVGANGRVNITTNTEQYTLVDLGGKNGEPSNWQLVVANASKPLAPFDQAKFLELLGGRK